jgi:hypothetical protein
MVEDRLIAKDVFDGLARQLFYLWNPHTRQFQMDDVADRMRNYFEVSIMIIARQRIIGTPDDELQETIQTIAAWWKWIGEVGQASKVETLSAVALRQAMLDVLDETTSRASSG